MSIIFFGGSWGTDPNHQKDPQGNLVGSVRLPGPDISDKQTPVWYSFQNLNVQFIQYPGNLSGGTAKANHARLAAGYTSSNMLVLGYSAGADSALIFADDYVTNNSGTGKITGVGLLGPTVSGTMLDGRNLRADGVLISVLNNLVLHGVNVYWLDDKAADGYQAKGYKKPKGAIGKFCFDNQSTTREHWDGGTTGNQGKGTNNDPAFRDRVLNWFNNPVDC